MCRHSISFAEHCEMCTHDAQQKQPAWNAATQLEADSKCIRTNADSPVTEIEISGEKFRIESIESKDDPTLSEVQTLFEQTFGEEEVDPEEVLRSSVEGKTPWGTDDINYRIFIVKNAEGKVISTVTGGMLDLESNDIEKTKRTMFMVAYAVTDKRVRQHGLAREAYISAIKDAAIRAERQGKHLSFAAGECTYTSEKFWNKVGWKRVYMQVPGEENKYEETRYVQPPLDFDPATGEPAEDAGEAPEHLMIDGFGSDALSKRDLKDVIRAFYQWNNRWPQQAFKNKDAFTRHNTLVDEIESVFGNDLNEHGDLKLLSQEERKKSQEEGVLIKDYVVADHGNAGQEDF